MVSLSASNCAAVPRRDNMLLLWSASWHEDERRPVRTEPINHSHC